MKIITLIIFLITTLEINPKQISYTELLKKIENKDSSKIDFQKEIPKNLKKNIKLGKKLFRNLNIKNNLDKNILQENIIKTLGGGLLAGGVATKLNFKNNIKMLNKIMNDQNISNIRILESTESDIDRLSMINKDMKRIVGKIENSTQALVFKMNVEIQKAYNQE